jgi:hypothetical protein
MDHVARADAGKRGIEIAAVTIARLKEPVIKELLVAGRSLDTCRESLV